jgi:hypothetical protein
VLTPRDRQWRRIVPGWADCVRLARGGLPFHVVENRRYDRSGDARKLRRALDSGATIYLPQVHEALPRVARLMVAIRASVLGPFRDEASFLFLVEGRGREGMGLHHDGRVDALWLQLEGRRSVTIGPRVRPGTPEDLGDDPLERGAPGWRTLDLAPGTLFYLPPFTPHRVICRGRSLALSLTWSAPRRVRRSARARALATWPVASGRAVGIPGPSSTYLWSQVPAVLDARGTSLLTPEGRIDLPRSARPLARELAAMPAVPRAMLRGPHRAAVAALVAHGVLDARDLPEAIVPANPRALDGWRFA